jgi:hypothetical protein
MRERTGYEYLQTLQGTVVPNLLGQYLVKFRDRELEEDQIVQVLLRECVPGKWLMDLPAWEAEMLSNVIESNVRKAVAAVNHCGIYFLSSLEGNLKVSDEGNVRFGDLVYWIKEKREKMKKCQEDAITSALRSCRAIKSK